jgi:hypothetical protein
MGKKILTDLEVKGYIDVDGGIKDANGDFGSAGRYLQTNGSDVVWADYNLQDDAVTQAKIADGAVGTAQLASYAIEAGHLANDAVTADKLAGWKTYNVTWGTTITNVTFPTADTLRIDHGLGTHFIIYSILDVSGTVAAEANAYVDVNHYADVYAKKINSNRTDFIFAADRTNGQVFKISLFGHP